MADNNLLMKIKLWADTVGILKAHRALGKTLKGIRAIGFAAARMSTGMASAFRGIRNMARNVFARVRLLALAAAAAIAGMVREAVRFKDAMAKVNTMVTGPGIVKMTWQVLRLAGAFGIAKSELAEGLYQALSAGVPKQNAISFLATAAKAAVGGATDVTTAVDGLTTVLNAFKIDSSKVEKVADTLFTTVKKGKTTFGELASSLAVVAPLAAATGISIEEIAAATATLTKQGTPTTVAMTQLRAAIIGLNENLGDGWAKTMTFQDGLKEIERRSGGSQVKLTKLMGRVEAVSAVLGTTGKNAKMAAGDLDTMSRSAGNLDEAFGKMSEARHWQRLWETIKGVFTKAGMEFDEALKPAVESITESIAKWSKETKFFDNLAEKLKNAGDYFKAALKTAKNTWDELKDVMQKGRPIHKVIVSAIGAGATLLFDAIVEAFRVSFGILAPIGKMIGVAIRAQLLQLPIWGLAKKRRAEAQEKIQTTDEETLLKLAQKWKIPGLSTEKSKYKGTHRAEFMGALINERLTKEQEAELATLGVEKEIAAAGKELPTNIEKSQQRLKKNAKQAITNISDVIGEITGGFKPKEDFAKNLREIQRTATYTAKIVAGINNLGQIIYKKKKFEAPAGKFQIGQRGKRGGIITGKTIRELTPEERLQPVLQSVQPVRKEEGVTFGGEAGRATQTKAQAAMRQAAEDIKAGKEDKQVIMRLINTMKNLGAVTTMGFDKIAHELDLMDGKVELVKSQQKHSKTMS